MDWQKNRIGSGVVTGIGSPISALNRRTIFLATLETENVQLLDGFTQVCVWHGTIVGKNNIDEFVKFGKEQFGARFQYLEEVTTYRDSTGPGGRNDVLFAVHSEDVPRFSAARLAYGIRWIEDVYANGQGNVYDSRIADYCSWVAPVPDYEDDD